METTKSSKVNEFINNKSIDKVIVFSSSVKITLSDGSIIEVYAQGRGELVYQLTK